MRSISLALVFFIIGCQSLPTSVSVEPDATYSHVATGLLFPPRLANFERTRITRYDPDGYDVSGSYRLRAPAHVEATVYNYPATSDLHSPSAREMEEHFNEISSEIVAVSPGGVVESRGIRKFIINEFELSGYFAHYYLPDFGRNGIAVKSRLYLFALDGWYLKFRFSTSDPIELADDEIQDFMTSVKWPKPSTQRDEPVGP